MNVFHKLGWVAGIGGVLLCIAGIAVRLGGAYHLGSFQVGTLLQAGIAAMVFGCFCLLAVLTRRH